jgi:beta-aspartyl-peptidase (threonine type)
MRAGSFRFTIPGAAVLVAFLGCAPGGGAPPAPATTEWALALHGGAGTVTLRPGEQRHRDYELALSQALERGRAMLDGGESALDTVEQVIRLLEDDPLFNAGRGAVFTREGVNELDASIMDGGNLGCGAVAGVTTVKNPITLARLVMEQTPHVLLSHSGAESFADASGVERVEQGYFWTERRWMALQESLEHEGAAADGGGTVGVVARDREGNLAAGTSTGGLTAKWHGRVGDSPIVGAGTYADNRTCAVSASGKGEEFIRIGVAKMISDMIAFGGKTLDAAAREVVDEILRPGDGGVIAVDRHGELVLVFNTKGMYRGAADSTGRFDVHVSD